MNEYAIEMKTCTRCKIERPIGQYSKDKSKKSGLRPYCKTCVKKRYNAEREKHKTYSKRHYAENREKYRTYSKRHYEYNREKHKTYSKNYYLNEKNKYKVATNTRRRKYGISEDEFCRLVNQQNNCCGICSKKFDYTPSVDHCHRTGEIRGILCNRCNTGLGQFSDSPELLENAIKYLHRKVKQ
jgi:hypothetical protein